MFILQCPKCKNNMKYQMMKGELKKKSKKCVYCGYTFIVQNNIVKEI